MVFLMMNTWCSKHVEDTKSWIKTFEKCAFVGLHYIIGIVFVYTDLGLDAWSNVGLGFVRMCWHVDSREC